MSACLVVYRFIYRRRRLAQAVKDVDIERTPDPRAYVIIENKTSGISTQVNVVSDGPLAFRRGNTSLR